MSREGDRTASPDRGWYRRTKIIATLGPASDRANGIETLVEAGVDVVRINLAHGTLDEHGARLRRVREAASRFGRVVGVLADLPGPKTRTAPFGETTTLQPGDRLEIVDGSTASCAKRIAVEDARLLRGLEPGDTVALGDGAVLLRIDEERSPARFGAVVMHGGTVRGCPGIRVPGKETGAPHQTDADRFCLNWCLESHVDMIAVSFVRSRDDIQRVRAWVGRAELLRVAKIETRAAVDNLDTIIDTADAIMVARGDLGIECPIEDVPHLQKHIVRSCITRGRPVITATQMLESMVSAPVPSRAEASDVANAVLDGADAVMLSAETAVGAHPGLVVTTMARIVQRAEREADYLQWGGRLAKIQETDGISPAVSHAAWRAALDAAVSAILCCTRSGATARTMARFRPLARLVALSPHQATIRQLALTWGTLPLPVPELDSPDAVINQAVNRSLAAGYIRSGEIVAVLSGTAVDTNSPTDTLRLLRVP